MAKSGDGGDVGDKVAIVDPADVVAPQGLAANSVVSVPESCIF